MQEVQEVQEVGQGGAGAPAPLPVPGGGGGTAHNTNATYRSREWRATRLDPSTGAATTTRDR